MPIPHPTPTPLEGETSPTVPNFEGSQAQGFVGAGREGLSVLLRRVRFVTHFIYWTCKHGSPKHAGWVCNYEGLWW